jgi:tellurite resistance protein TehA-like permease
MCQRLFLFGKDALMIFPKTGALPLVPSAGEMLYIFGFIGSLLMWGFGLLWFFFAVATIYKCRKFPFNMGWWSFTFPIGVLKSPLCLLFQASG